MTWHLKDRELERKLVELYPSFLDDLKFGVMNKENRHCVHVECTRVRGNGDIPNDTVSFWDDELKEVPEYNPNDWNEYPKVTPSENIPMRVETESGGYIYRECAIFNEGVWKCERDGNADEELYGHVKRFRPWED